MFEINYRVYQRTNERTDGERPRGDAEMREERKRKETRLADWPEIDRQME